LPEIIPLTCGWASAKEAMKRGRGSGAARWLAIFKDHAWTPMMPIHVFAIRSDDGILLVDTGSLADVRDLPFVRFQMSPEEEVDRALAAVGIDRSDLSAIVMTHLHGDHMDGLARLPGVPVLVAEEELRAVARPAARLQRRVFRTPLPHLFAPTTLRFDGPPVGAFPRSSALTADGSVLAVPAPGHTPGHTAILVDHGDHHTLLTGDAAYDLPQLLDVHPDGICPDPAVSRATMERILEHARMHPTVIAPSHDPETVRRLAEAEVARSRYERLDDGPLDHAVAETERPRRLRRGPATAEPFRNAVRIRIENARQR